MLFQQVPSEDMPGAKGPGPYRDEHESGGTRFRELLARAKKTDPYIEQRAGVRPTSSRGQQQQDGRIPREARPPRPVRPADAPNYDDPAQWDRIGSPSLPDPPLRNEMPGMQLPREMDAGELPFELSTVLGLRVYYRGGLQAEKRRTTRCWVPRLLTVCCSLVGSQ